MTQPNIVMVIPDLKGNGAERVVLNLAAGFSAQNCAVHVVVFNKFVELESNNGFELHHFRQNYRWLPRGVRAFVVAPLLDIFIRKITRGGGALILSNLLPVDRILCKSKLDNVFLMVHTLLGEDLPKGEAAAQTLAEYRRVYAQKPLVCVSKGVKADADEVLDSQFPAITIYNPIDFDFIQHSAPKSAPIWQDYLIFVGKLKNSKRVDVLIRAYGASKVPNPLVLVGQGDGLTALKALVAELKLEKQVIFAGFMPNPYPLIKNARLMVLSSDYEGLGMVILEAIALKTPVISTDCRSGPAEILPKRNLSPVGDVNALANQIQAAVLRPEDYLTELRAEFSLKFATKRYLSLLK